MTVVNLQQYKDKKDNRATMIFTAEELAILIDSIADGEAVTEAEIKQLLDWAENARYQASLVSLIIQGVIVPKIENGAITFTASNKEIEVTEDDD